MGAPDRTGRRVSVAQRSQERVGAGRQRRPARLQMRSCSPPSGTHLTTGPSERGQVRARAFCMQRHLFSVGQAGHSDEASADVRTPISSHRTLATGAETRTHRLRKSQSMMNRGTAHTPPLVEMGAAGTWRRVIRSPKSSSGNDSPMADPDAPPTVLPAGENAVRRNMDSPLDGLNDRCKMLKHPREGCLGGPIRSKKIEMETNFFLLSGQHGNLN